MANQYSCWCSVTPSILLADNKIKTVTIHPQQSHIAGLLNKEFAIKVTRTGAVITNNVDETMQNTPDTPYIRKENGDMVFEMTAELEGEYSIMLYEKNPDGTLGKWISFQVYALEKDLFELNPYKGDFHMHSYCSDGYESPAYVAASCRLHGMDFMALTDHKQYAPSLEAKKAMEDFGCDMLMFPGEEVHLPGNPTHIVNFGGNKSINDLAYNDLDKYNQEVASYMKNLPAFGDATTQFEIAASEWTFDRIKESGGIALFCHPYWRPVAHNYVGDEVVNAIYERKKFDAVEVFGGFDRPAIEFNILSMTRFYEECAKGNKLSPVGVSDAHGSDERLSGWYYTIVFAPSLDFADISKAIRERKCVAVQDIPGAQPIAAGELRLVKFVYFLLREFYPAHDALCKIEGEIIRRALAGLEPDAKNFIASRKGSVAEYISSAKER